jgi:uncharacterized nucleotidyltransferase DUF6036
MNPAEFEHVLAAAAEVTGQNEFVVIGSQAIIGSYGQPPESMLQSLEADIYPLRDPGGADLIDGALGDGSPFHLAFGYYAHGVGPETAKAPRGWQKRLVMREIPPRLTSKRTAIAWCLEVHDLVLSKCAAGRERDWDYASEALRAQIVQGDVLLARVPDLPVPEKTCEHVDGMLRGIIASL